MRRKLDILLAQHAGKRLDGRTARDRTKALHSETIRAIYNRLHALGYKIENPENICERHIRAIVQDWHARGLAPKTIQNHRSRLSIFCRRIGKPNLVKPLQYYLPDIDPKSFVVHSAAKQSKSWAEANVNIIEVFKAADREDERFGLILRVMLAFGLRRMEALSCYPWKSIEGGTGWSVYPSEAKGARPRLIPIDTPEKRKIIEYVCARIKKGDRLRWNETRRNKPASLKYAEARFKYYMQKIGLTKNQLGVTGHGLRAQFCENASILLNFIPPTLGGSGGDMSKEDLDIKRRYIAELLGHARTIVTIAYLGSIPRYPLQNAMDLNRAIQEGLREIERANLLETVEDDLRDDCKRIMLLLADFDVAVTLRQIQTLWRRHSERHATRWVKPEKGEEIIAGLFVAATKHLRMATRDAA